MISFVIYFHSRRVENLRQTLRNLGSRETCDKEIVLVCNDRTEGEFPGCRLFNLGLTDYQKPRMCNLGIREATGSMVALLDSDRILPPGYFTRLEDSLGPGEFASCERILKLDRDYTDEEINRGRFNFTEDFRSKNWEIRKKNLFSGNTVFFREDYLASGGMDESFVGYGFADNDMTRNVISQGFKPRWIGADEIHLHHPMEVMESETMVGFDDYRKTSQKNLCRFLKKWRMKEYWRHCGCL